MNLKHFFFFGFFLAGFLVPALPAEAEAFTCMGEYYKFILNVRSENSRSESIQDVFKLGYCQLNDIMTLDDELDSVKDNFRTAANACTSTTAYKDDYERILMEMYFVRHLQDEGALDAVDQKVLEELKEEKLASLESDMKEKFVDEEERVDESTFSSYFATWSAKYDDRVADYRDCEEGPWAELTPVWNDFITTIKELDFTIDIDEDGGSSFKDIITPSIEGDPEQDMTAIGNTVKNSFAFLKGEKEKREAEIENAKTVDEVGNAGAPLSFDEVIKTLNASFEDHDLLIRSAARMSEYSTLYGSGGSVQSTNLQGIVVELNSVLQGINVKDLPGIASNSKKVSDKQCN